jgi:hypothetical protein
MGDEGVHAVRGEDVPEPHFTPESVTVGVDVRDEDDAGAGLEQIREGTGGG